MGIEKNLTLKALHISIPIIDMNSAINFYRDILGLEMRASSDALTQMYCEKNRLSLKKTSSSSDSIQRDSLQGIRSRHIGFKVESKEVVDALETKFREAKVRIVLPCSQREDGYTLFVVDPSGNQVEIFCEDDAHQ